MQKGKIAEIALSYIYKYRTMPFFQFYPDFAILARNSGLRNFLAKAKSHVSFCITVWQVSNFSLFPLHVFYPLLASFALPSLLAICLIPDFFNRME